MEKVHTYAMKRFLCVPIHSSNTVLYGETARYPLYIRTFVKCIKHWLRILKLPQARLCRQAYDMMVTQMGLGKENWAYQAKKILSEHGFEIVWLSQLTGNDQQFILEFKDRLICSFKKNPWHSDMESKERNSWFVSFRSVFQAEKYLSVIKDKWQRINYARFTLRTMNFKANKRCFNPETSTDSPCPACNYITDDEKHFLFQCRAYDTVRTKYEFFEMGYVKLKMLLPFCHLIMKH